MTGVEWKVTHYPGEEFHEMRIGNFYLSPSAIDKERIHIRCEDGEGGDFVAAKFEKAIRAFYDKEF